VPPSTTTTAPASTPPWPERVILQSTAVEAIDPATGHGFALSPPPGTSQGGPYRLQRINLADRSVSEGPSFPLAYYVVDVDGYLWVSGTTDNSSKVTVGPMLFQVDPRTLAIIRGITVGGPGSDCNPSVAPGAGTTVWIGCGQKLFELNAATGTTVRTVPLPAGVTVGSLATDPSLTHLYVSVSDPSLGPTIEEFDAATAALATSTRVGSALTSPDISAGPSGVWASFRVGMSGATVLLGQRDLTRIAPSQAETAAEPDGIFGWMMGAETFYSANTLWITSDGWPGDLPGGASGGVLACLDPATGVVRAREASSSLVAFTPLATDTVHGLLYLLAQDNELIAVTPPRACW
jgi:hypothetical protein